VPVDVTAGIVEVAADPTREDPADFVKRVASSATRRAMKVLPDDGRTWAVPADGDLLPLRSVLDDQIRRVERQTKQQAAVETPVGDCTVDQRPGSQQRKHAQPRFKFEHPIRRVSTG
jgi:hypothetical protein